MYIKSKSISFFTSTYTLIQRQFEGKGTCFYKFYLLQENDQVPEKYIGNKILQASLKQKDLQINRFQASSYDRPFNYDIYQLTPYVGIKQRKFLLSIFSETTQLVGSILITGYDLTDNLEKPFCQIILDNQILLDSNTVFDTELRMFYPIPIKTGVRHIITDTPELFEQVVTDNIYQFSCPLVSTSNIKLDCFHYFDLFNYFVYGLVNGITDKIVSSDNTQLTIQNNCCGCDLQYNPNRKIRFTINDLVSPVLEPQITSYSKLSNTFINFRVQIPLNVTNTISSLSVLNNIGRIDFKTAIICSNYVNVGNDYFTLDVGVDITRWINYLSFLIRL